MSEEKVRVKPEESLDKMIASLKEKTGRTLDEWAQVITKRGWQKHGEIMGGIKSEFGVSHGFANQIALRWKEALGVKTAQRVDDPVGEIFMKRLAAKPLYEALLSKIEAFGTDVEVAPKKAYVSLRRAKQFAILQPAADRLDVGIVLKGVEPTERLEPSGSFNAMVTHRVRVSDASQIDAELLGWLEQAYAQAG